MTITTACFEAESDIKQYYFFIDEKQICSQRQQKQSYKKI